MNTINYYKKNYEKIFNAVENPQWRIWKIVDKDNTIRQNKLQITTPKRLLDFITKSKNPKALYVSISEFLNPHKVHGFFWNQKVTTRARYFYPRAGYLYADSVLLDSYFFIDLDSKGDMKDVQRDAKKIYEDLMFYTNLNLHSIQFSGKKGVHLIYKMNKPNICKNICNPIERINYYSKEKQRIINGLLDLGLETIDKNHINIMKDNFRVYAVPYSIKENGNIVQPLNIQDFLTNDVLSFLTAKTIEAKANESKVALAKEQSLAIQLYQDKKRDGLSSYPIQFKFMDNMVNGLKNNYVTIIKKHKKRFKVKELKEIQKTYKLSDFYIVEIGDYIYAYNTKTIQFQRLAKILKKIKSENLSFFLTRKHLPIQITKSVYPNGETANTIEQIGILKSNYGLYDNHSKPHSDLFGLSYKNLVGNVNNIGIMKVS